jgi:LysM repeat protein
MARYSAGARGRRTRNRIYTVLAVLVVVIVLVYFYGPFGNGETETVNEGPPMNANPDFEVPVAGESIDVNEPPVRTDIGSSSMQDTVSVEKPTLAEIPSGPTVEPNPEAAALIKEATELLSKTPIKLIEARDKLNIALRMPMSVEQRKFVKNKLSELADKWLFSRTVYPDDPLCETYQVGKGEIFAFISDKYKVPYQILMQINNISDPRSLLAGQNIKVIKGPFSAKVYRSTFTMDIYLQNTFIRSFIVGLGLPGKETPTGIWRVAADGKMERPIWYDEIENKTYYPEDPDYPLGSRWIGLEGLEGEAKGREGFAIHGTKEPQQLGTQGSRGCIRLENGNVILVYNLLYPVDSLVEVTD